MQSFGTKAWIAAQLDTPSESVLNARGATTEVPRGRLDHPFRQHSLGKGHHNRLSPSHLHGPCHDNETERTVSTIEASYMDSNQMTIRVVDVHLVPLFRSFQQSQTLSLV